ncbi:aminodeoxychorismate/anthranilate synthase component II [Aestuariibacter halophilus]|uniref:anthranilate synthase n=1 Tax=Fluctibacter halophilus TaxID=226011 RepID=A0ABS8G459_9ALTE|nr:aminodeoxychorismate/anthranilate synthase component II [Aestuariibacter halophilus]MCC2615263.1 aminodeoxychorismate/anthranilate synthase component II [Aestuariibacter halophilus]
MSSPVSIFLLDNVDSFTYNLVDELRGLGHDLVVYRNHVAPSTILAAMAEKAKSHRVILLLSPGPGAPQQAGCMPTLLKQVAGVYPVLGICLGHQAIVEHYGGRVVRANTVMHGKSSPLIHQGEGVFHGLPSPMPIARYHSLMVTDLPAQITELASSDGVPMAVLHQQHRMLGFQFHPESILTPMGSTLLQNSIEFLLAAPQQPQQENAHV